MAKRSKKTSSPIQAVPEDGLYADIGIEDIEAGVAATSMAWMEVDSRIVDELGAIAFSDLGDFVDWDNETQHVAADIKDRIDADVETGDRPAAEVVTITNRVTLKPSHKLTPALRRAVAKVSQDRYGNVRVEMHDKLAALDKLARALGMYQEPAHVEDHSKTDMRATIIYEGRADRPPRRPAPPKPVGGPRDTGD
jgi:hypothetical protein